MGCGIRDGSIFGGGLLPKLVSQERYRVGGGEERTASPFSESLSHQF